MEITYHSTHGLALSIWESFFGVWKKALILLMTAWICLSPVLAQQDPPGCSGSGLGIALFVDKPQAHLGDTLNYSALVYNSPFPACKASGITAWLVTPDGVTNVINLRRNVLNPGESDNYPNVATYVVRAQDMVGGVVRAIAADQARIHQNETLSHGEAAQTVNTVIVNPCIEITAACTNGIGQDGRIGFSGTVRNCGDVNLASVTVTNLVDGVGRLVFGPVNLAAGQSTNFTGSYSPANPCSLSSAVYIATGADTLKQPKTVTASTTAACSLVITPGIALGHSCPAAPVAVGSPFVYSGSVTNTGDVTLTNVVVVSDQPAPGTMVYSVASLAPRAVANFTAQFNAPSNSCALTTTLRVTATSRCGQMVVAESSRTCPLSSRPAIVVTQTCPADAVAPGGLLTYNGTVRNSGNITLQDVSVTSAGSGAVVFSLNRLEPGETAAFTGSYTTPLDACSATNRLVASARDVCSSQAVSNTVTTVCNLTTAPALAITQSCPAASPALGGTLTYSATVQNTGNVTLQNVAVVSERPNNSVVFQIASLPPGGMTNFTASYPVPSNLNGCSITNRLRVTGSDRCSSQQVSASVTTVCLVQASPRVRIVANCPAAPAAPGTNLTYTGTVSNAGDITLATVSIVADQPTAGTVVLTVTNLAPGASANFTGTYIAPLDACSSTVILTATAVDACAGSTVSDRVTQTCPLISASSLAVTLDCPPAPVPPGQPLVLTGRVSNTGNVTLTNLVVEINRANTGTPIFGPVRLAPGASLPFTGSFVVPTNLNSCTITTTATARGNNQCNGTAVSATATSVCTVRTRPALVLTTQCPPTPTAQGALLTFTGTVQNVGDIALTNVVVVSSRPTNGAPVVRIGTLLPNQSTNFTGSFIVPVNCCEIVTTLTATGADLCGISNVVDTATMICPVLYTPGVRITRECPTQPVSPGDQFRFTGIITNTGNITLTEVTVLSDIMGRVTPLMGPIDLAPGQSMPYSGSFLVTPDYCGLDTVLVTGRSICGNAVSDSVTSTCPILTTPGIAVLNIPAGPLVSCGSAVGRGTLANTGDVALTNIMVFCNQPTNNTPVLGPLSLAPGAVTNFSYSYTAPNGCNCCEVPVTLTATGRGRCDNRLVSSSSTLVVPVQTAPQLTINLDCANLFPGSSFATGLLLNSGDIALSNVVVVSSLPNPGTRIAGPINLSPGESQFLIADLTTTDPALLSSFNLIATGNNICGGAEVRASAGCSRSPPGPLTIRFTGNNSITLSWKAAAGTRNRVEFKNSWADAAWQVLGEDIDIASSEQPVTKVDQTDRQSTRFYRVRLVE